jgi:hypothetical protein
MRASLPIAIGIAVLLTAPCAYATSYRIGPASQQEGPSRASAGGSITVKSSTPGAGGSPGGGGAPAASGTSGSPAGAESGVSAGSSSSSSSSGGREPLGGGSYRYTGTEGQECFYLTEGINTCEGEAAPAAPAQPARPAVNPEAIAATVVSRLNLGVGKIVVSPSARTEGLTGAASWFWLEPAPATQSVSLALHGEHLTVSAAPNTVQWSFGDGTQLTGGAGVPYRPGPAPAGAVSHVYETRCLPGDRGRDPNVSASCGANGYQVQAAVEWAISYQAAGPVTVGGALPARATDTTISYPVSEVRAFLTGAGGR